MSYGPEVLQYEWLLVVHSSRWYILKRPRNSSLLLFIKDLSNLSQKIVAFSRVHVPLLVAHLNVNCRSSGTGFPVIFCLVR